MIKIASVCILNRYELAQNLLLLLYKKKEEIIDLFTSQKRVQSETAQTVVLCVHFRASRNVYTIQSTTVCTQ